MGILFITYLQKENKIHLKTYEAGLMLSVFYSFSFLFLQCTHKNNEKHIYIENKNTANKIL